MENSSISLLRHCRKLFFITQLMKHQWYKEKDLIKIQEKRLRTIINHAYQNVPYYLELFDSVGIKPEDVKSVKDLKKIPILTKDDIRKNYPDKLVSKNVNINNCFIRSTTGSTGVPLKIAFSHRMQDYSAALLFFVFFQCGLKLTDRLVSIRHSGYLTNNNFLKNIRIFKWENISIFTPIESIIQSLKNKNPDVIATYPSMLLLLSQKIKELKIGGINPRIILTSGETLSDDSRDEISEVFNSDVYRLYGTEEFGRLALECNKSSGYHIISDAAIIEVVKDNRDVADDEDGEIVVTSLFNNVMPLIRYKLGDIGRLSKKKCKCGRGFPLINSIEGRKDDFLILPSGKKVSPRVINVIEDIPGVSRYKTIQETKNRIVVNLVKGKDYGEKTISEIKKHIKVGCLGENVEVEVKIVKEIPLEKGGKLRAVISRVKE